MRSFKLDSADDMQAVPRQIKWVRDGLLVVSLSTEMQVFSQWSPLYTTAKPNCKRNSFQENYHNLSDIQESFNQKLMMPRKHSILDLHKLNKVNWKT